MHAKAEQDSPYTKPSKVLSGSKDREKCYGWNLLEPGKQSSEEEGKTFPAFPDQMSFWLLLAFIACFMRELIV